MKFETEEEDAARSKSRRSKSLKVENGVCYALIIRDASALLKNKPEGQCFIDFQTLDF